MTALLQKKSIIVLTVPVMLFVVWLNIMYLPTNSKIQSAGSEFFGLNQELQQCQATIGQISSIKQRVGKIETELSECLSEISSVDSISEFIRMIDSDLKEFGIIDRSITPRLPDLLESKKIDLGEQKLNRVEFKVRGQGEYIQLGRFIEKINRESFYASSGNLEIVTNDNINPRVLFEWKFIAYLKTREN